VGRIAVPLHEWLATVVHTGRVLEIAALSGKAVYNITELAILVLQL
jgi:hypothetical protein